MTHLWKRILGCVFVAPALVVLSVPAVAEVQRFTDEAGELLYTIDEQGIVSMFENSPGTDVTLSVTRGTREQMQPQVTEVIPETVPAGSFTILKLRGKNLVGAKVKLSVPSIEVKNHLGKPKELDVPINVPLELPPGEVILEVTTPIGRATARFKTSEVQIGGSGTRPDVITHPGMGYGADEGARSIPMTAPVSCPAGMVGVPAEGGGFCIEIDRSFSGDFKKADQSCAIASKRLCRLPELRAACEQAKAGRLPLKNMIGEWEWTGTYDIVRDFSTFADSGGDPVYFLLGKADCATPRTTRQFDTKAYVGRCCK